MDREPAHARLARLVRTRSAQDDLQNVSEYSIDAEGNVVGEACKDSKDDRRGSKKANQAKKVVKKTSYKGRLDV